MVLKHYANLSFGQTHYRRAGAGKPIVLLHASPMSSETMLPMIANLAASADVIAPDTPGYGASDSLPENVLNEAADLTPYVEWLSEYLEVMGLERIGLYGTATGAQIAIEFARTYPEKLDYVILDNAAHFTDQEREEIMSRYFPELKPDANGGHLMRTWDMADGLFKWFPWYAQDEEHRISDTEPPAEMVHTAALAYLIAGPDYAQAYRRAFGNENAARVLDIKVPVRVIRWQSSILKKYVDRYDQFDWPEHIQMVHCGASPQQRYEAIRKSVAELL